MDTRLRKLKQNKLKRSEGKHLGRKDRLMDNMNVNLKDYYGNAFGSIKTACMNCLKLCELRIFIPAHLMLNLYILLALQEVSLGASIIKQLLVVLRKKLNTRTQCLQVLWVLLKNNLMNYPIKTSVWILGR